MSHSIWSLVTSLLSPLGWLCAYQFCTLYRAPNKPYELLHSVGRAPSHDVECCDLCRNDPVFDASCDEIENSSVLLGGRWSQFLRRMD